MVVLCLRFWTGTQILIYFPVLLQISSVTSGQLLWEKHVKAPKWLMNPSPFTKRGIAADSQREKHMGMVTIAKTIPKVTVFYHITCQFWAPRSKCLSLPASRRMAAFWMVVENEQEVAWEGGTSCPLTSCGYCWGRQSWEFLPLMVSFLLSFHWWLIFGRGSDVMPESVQAEGTRTGVVNRFTLRETGTPGYLHAAFDKK